LNLPQVVPLTFNQQILVNQTLSLPLWIASHGGKNNEICDLSLARHLNLAVKNLPGFGQKINGLIINKKIHRKDAFFAIKNFCQKSS
jgi:hypothetical protein